MTAATTQSCSICASLLQGRSDVSLTDLTLSESCVVCAKLARNLKEDPRSNGASYIHRADGRSALTLGFNGPAIFKLRSYEGTLNGMVNNITSRSKYFGAL
jgi:hypothetical protein